MMSAVHKSIELIVLDHKNYITNLYKNVKVSQNTICSFEMLDDLFSIVVNKKRTQRKRSSEHTLEETMKVKEMYERYSKVLTEDLGVKCKMLDTTLVRSLSSQLFETTVFDHIGISGSNYSDSPLKCKIKNDYFLIPQNSRFICGCVKEQCLKLNDKYSIIVADPPWWNKYIRRLKGANSKLSYTMMYNEEIAAIPVKKLMLENCLIAVWCTNSPSNIAAVKELIFPNWGVTYLTTWYWLKVTTEFEPMCQFGTGSQKQPYERLILGKVGNINDVPKENLIMSIPSALHSHKPPLLELLSPYVCDENPQVLELFARYLLPNTTSIGFEPLKWQHISLYKVVT